MRRSLGRCGRFGRSGKIRSGQLRSLQEAISRQRTHARTRPRCSRMRAHRDGDGRTNLRLLARLGIGFAESHAAPHERALGSLLSAASNAQHPPARPWNSLFLYDISQRSETRASPSRPYNTFTQRAKEPPYQRVYIVFWCFGQTSRAVSISNQVAMIQFIYRATPPPPRGM